MMLRRDRPLSETRVTPPEQPSGRWAKFAVHAVDIGLSVAMAAPAIKHLLADSDDD